MLIHFLVPFPGNPLNPVPTTYPEVQPNGTTVAEIFAVLLPVVVPTATLLIVLLAYVDSRSRNRKRQATEEMKTAIQHQADVLGERIKQLEDRIKEIEKRLRLGQRWR